MFELYTAKQPKKYFSDKKKLFKNDLFMLHVYIMSLLVS